MIDPKTLAGKKLSELPDEMKLRIVKFGVNSVGHTIDANRDRLDILYAEHAGLDVETAHRAITVALDVLGVVFRDIKDAQK